RAHLIEAEVILDVVQIGDVERDESILAARVEQLVTLTRDDAGQSGLRHSRRRDDQAEGRRCGETSCSAGQAHVLASAQEGDESSDRVAPGPGARARPPAVAEAPLILLVD